MRLRAEMPLWVCTFVGCSLIASPMWALPASQPSLGTLDFRDVAGYRRRLQSDSSPFARALRSQIANGPQDLPIQRKAMRRLKLPLTPQELSVPSAPAAQNAAPFYVQLRAELRQRPLTPRFVFLEINLDHETAPSAEELHYLQEEINQRPEIFKLLAQATAQPKCSFSRNWNAILKDEFIEMEALTEGARALRVQSYLQAKQGHFAEAIITLAKLFHIARHATSDPILEALNKTASTVDRLALFGLRDALTLVGPDSKVTNAAQQALTQGRIAYDLRHNLEGDLVRMALNMEITRHQTPQQLFRRQFLNFPDPQRKAPAHYTPAERRFVLNLLDASEASLLRQLRYLVGLLDKSDPQRLDLFAAAGDRIFDANPAAPVNPLDIFRDSEPRNTFLIMPDNLALLEASRAAVCTGSALLAYKAKTGSFPEHLEDALSPLSRDPFSGKALQYRHEGEGCVVFSIGPGRRFDGGAPGMKANLAQAYFRYVPPSAPAPAPAK